MKCYIKLFFVCALIVFGSVFVTDITLAQEAYSGTDLSNEKPGQSINIYINSFPTQGEVLGAVATPIPDLSGKGCFFLKNTLKMGKQNDQIEVAKLQYFLKTYEGFSNLMITGVFNTDTFNAVSLFQKKYAKEVLYPWGYNTPTGVVYILTQKKINEIVCKTTFELNPTQKIEIESIKNNIKAKNTLENFDVGLISEDSVLGEISSTSTVIAGISDIDNTVVTLAPENDKSSVVNSTVFNIWNSFATNNTVRDMSAAIFTIPKADDFFNGAILFVIILLLFNILSSVTQQQKRIVFFVGSLLALFIAVFFGAYYLFFPFIAVILMSVFFTKQALTTKKTVVEIKKPEERSLAQTLPLSIIEVSNNQNNLQK